MSDMEYGPEIFEEDCGKWFKLDDKKPEHDEVVLIFRKRVRLAVYNEYDECWDDPETDDYMCELEFANYWMRIPETPNTYEQ